MATALRIEDLPHGVSLAGPASAQRQPYDVRSIAWQTALLCGLFLLNKAGTPGAAVFFLILTYMALRSTTGAFKALMIVGLGITLNQFFVPKSLLWTPARLAITSICAARCIVSALGGKSTRVPAYFLAMVMFCVVAAICSVLSGYYLLIALLKLSNFFAVTTATLLAIEIIRRQHDDLGPWFVALLGAVVVFGLLSIPLGQSTNFTAQKETLDGMAAASGSFNGAFLHPNTHSSIAAPAFVYLLAAAIFSTYRSRWICSPMAAILAVFMVWSQARTSIAAAIAGALVLILFASPGRLLRGRRLQVNLRRGTLVGLVALAVVGVGVSDMTSGGSISRSIIGFMNKSQQTEELDTSDIIKSREGKIAESWANFVESPIYGIGFQVGTDEYFRNNATLLTAPCEKGFLYTALLEEGGILGTTAFAVFAILFFGTLVFTRNVPGLAVAVALFLSTTFEVGIFAMGGSGTFFWTFAGAGIMLGDHCWVEMRRFAPAAILAGHWRAPAGALRPRHVTS